MRESGEMSQAGLIEANIPLCEKIADAMRERMGLIVSETGSAPRFVKYQFQMDDDSVFEMRIEVCPDGCGQLSIVAESFPE